MARTPNQTEVTQHITTDAETPGLPTMADAWNEMAVMEQEINENALTVAREINYDGPMTLGGLDDGIRFYQRRTAEGCMEIGKRLLVMKELAPRGEFLARIQLHGLSKSTAYRFMQAARKFSKLPKLGTLAVTPESAGRFLELLILDDDELKELDEGGTVRGINFDSIDLMTATELKKALRDANERIEAKDAVIKDKSAKIDTQAETIASLAAKKQKADAEPVSVDQALIDARSTLQATAIRIKMDIASRLMPQALALIAMDNAQNTYAGALVIDIKRELDIVVGDCGLPTVIDTDPTPEWMRPGALDELEAQYAQPSGFELPDED